MTIIVALNSQECSTIHQQNMNVLMKEIGKRKSLKKV